MAALTITVDDDLLRSARLRAIEQRTTLDAILNAALVGFTEVKDGGVPASEFLAFAISSSGSSRRAGREVTRETLHLDRFKQ